MRPELMLMEDIEEKTMTMTMDKVSVYLKNSRNVVRVLFSGDWLER